MRVTILDRGHGFGTKTLFMVIRAMPRQPVLDVMSSNWSGIGPTFTADRCSE
jgi:hypothetical protein